MTLNLKDSMILFYLLFFKLTPQLIQVYTVMIEFHFLQWEVFWCFIFHA